MWVSRRFLSPSYDWFNAILDKLFTYEGISSLTLQYKKTYWLIIAMVTIYVGCMCIPANLLGASSLLLYGFVLLGMWIPFLILFPILPYPLKWSVHFSQHMAIIITFLIIIRLGGIPQCGGIILGGLNSVIFSVLFYSVRWSVWYFFLFVSCTVANHVIQTSLKVPPEMTPEVNQFFFLINTLFLGGLTLVVVLIYLFQHTRYEKERAQRLQELDEVKTRLFTNITHEFRTPLTVIQGMVDQMKSDPLVQIDQKLENIYKSSQDLLDLVNQMLELARLDAGAVKRNLVKGDIIAHLKMVFESIQAEADSKNLDFRFNPYEEEYVMEFDPEGIKHIAWNLLTNAVKYTSDSGKIILSTRISRNEVPKLILTVEDSGEGIPGEELDQVFSRFFRGQEERIQKIPGTGLGLSITKELVELLEGEISVESSEESGTRFTVKLPVSYKEGAISEDKFHPDELNPLSYERVYGDQVPNSDEHPSVQGALKNGNPLLLIVEDNREVAQYLYDIMNAEYRVIRALDGRTGLESALDKIPDLIISDIMMPVMDGIMMLEQLRKDIRTSHIPIILLTAKADISSRIAGLESGAILYLAKPFQKQELMISIRNILILIDQMKERYSCFPLPEREAGQEDTMEYKFMKTVQQAFKENLSDPDFGVVQLCKLTNMSRAQLYRKLNALTGNSVKQYLSRFRLHMAKEQLRHTDLSVTQIAFQAGFRNHSHFSRRFRKEYGISPSAFRASTI